MINHTFLEELQDYCAERNVDLVAVSKTKPLEAIQEAYVLGQRIFGENRVQELSEKHPAFPEDVQWHMIGHLQRNKVKVIAPFIHLIHSVDSIRLLEEINKQAIKNERVIPFLFQMHIVEETNKFGFEKDELMEFLKSDSFNEMTGVAAMGMMGMATFTDNQEQLKREFSGLKNDFDFIKDTFFNTDEKFSTLSMGMSGDYKLAIECGSTMVRIGSSIFGSR